MYLVKVLRIRSAASFVASVGSNYSENDQGDKNSRGALNTLLKLVFSVDVLNLYFIIFFLVFFQDMIKVSSISCT